MRKFKVVLKYDFAGGDGVYVHTFEAEDIIEAYNLAVIEVKKLYNNPEFYFVEIEEK